MVDKQNFVAEVSGLDSELFIQWISLALVID